MAIEIDETAAYSIEYGLHTADAQRALHFYRDTLGMVPIGEIFAEHCHVWALRLGNSMLKILQDNEPPQVRNPPGRAIGFRYITLHVVELDRIVDECRTAGFEIAVPPTSFTPLHGRSCRFAFVHDPDGNSIELSEGSPWVPPTPQFASR